MSEVTRIVIELARPHGSFPGKIAEGHYTVEGDTVVLTDKHGTAVDRYRLTEKLSPNGSAKAAACNLLRSRYSASSGDFHRHLVYPRLGKI